MAIFPHAERPVGGPRPARRVAAPGRPARPPDAREVEALAELARLTPAEALVRFGCSRKGLTTAEAAARLAHHGHNEVDVQTRDNWVWAILRALGNPLVLLLVVLAAVALATGNVRAAVVVCIGKQGKEKLGEIRKTVAGAEKLTSVPPEKVGAVVAAVQE